MAKNATLSAARNAKMDEFYTQAEDIVNELNNYKEHFVGKIIYCNCDNPAWSEFWKYFHVNFTKLGLKKLISTHYNSENPTYKLEYTGGNDDNIQAGVKTPLMGNGDFRSEECLAILQESDICCTNPPFSLWRHFCLQLLEQKKQFIILGTINAITYKELFPYLQSNQMWTGYTFNKTMCFEIPDDYPTYDHITADGKKIAKVAGITWYTNLPKQKDDNELVLTESYYHNPSNYPQYVNFDGIEVSKVNAIPYDYYGAMGVPVTFLDKYNPQEFRLIGHSSVLCQRMSTIAKDGEYMKGGLRPYILKENGPYKYKRLYDRLFIQRIRPETQE